jgi:hypothetical protein
MAGLVAVVASMQAGPSHAAAPALGSREGELLCAGLTGVLASGALLTTGADAAAAAKAHGIFLGRLSVIAPDARFRVEDFQAAYEKMTPADQNELMDACFGKLKQIEANSGPTPEKAR